MITKTLKILSVAFIFFSCKEAPMPKPKAHLSLVYPPAEYQTANIDCPFSFEKNKMAQINSIKDCSFKMEYAQMKASLFITYKNVDKNLDSLLADAQKLTYEHVVKADGIVEQPFVNKEERVYGMLYHVKGNAASQSQFYITDSTRHFITGSAYFYAKPNYDSILPASEYLENDIKRFMETFKWN